MYRLSPLQKKILIVLLGGITLSLSYSPKQYFRTLRAIRKDWQNTNQQNFNRSIRKLIKEKILEEKIMSDGSIKLILTKEGKKHAKIMSILGKSIKFVTSKRWDKKWRIVIFDIPEKDRLFRDILRKHLKFLKFYKLQHSVFISPYPFEKQILEMIKIYSAQKYVRVITALKIDNENEIKKHFLS